MNGLDRLLRPRTVAVVGGGTWGASTVHACQRIGFDGAIWPVHPTRSEVGGLPAFASLSHLPAPPDATFVGVNRETTIDIVAQLSSLGGGGAVCFASGFQESKTDDGARLQNRFVNAAGDMPVIGPNCYGFINALDGAALWPDQFGLTRVDRGVAIISQSSNVALNLTMQRRGLPLAYIVTVGNQAQTDLAQIAHALLEDPRVSALGLHIEGIRDIRSFECMAATARKLGKGIVALKVGTSELAQAATISHTASLAGSDAGARALLKRLGVARVESLSDFLETLKILHVVGPLKSKRIASLSCSGGEAGLMADIARARGIEFPPLTQSRCSELRTTLGTHIALANPLDYHTDIWGDRNALARVFGAMCSPDLAMCCVILDFPRDDRCEAPEWDEVIQAVVRAKEETGTSFAILSSLPENLPEEIAQRIMDLGVVPLNGLPEGVNAIAAAAEVGTATQDPPPVLLPGTLAGVNTLSEDAAKARLADQGLEIPRSRVSDTPEGAAAVAEDLRFPLVVKGQGAAHKTEAGLVALNLQSKAAVGAAAATMQAPNFLVEEMVEGAVAELLVGVVRDPAHGFVLTIGAGGTLSEILKDTVTLLLPATESELVDEIARLRIAPQLTGYRCQSGIDMQTLIQAVRSVEAFVLANANCVVEVEVNPLICTKNRAVAADALIRMGRDE